MLKLKFGTDPRRPTRLLCIGAHSDDLEIGCGGTIITWLETFPNVDVTWVVLSADALREKEARKSAAALLRKARQSDVVVGGFRDGFLPAQYSEAKEFFERVKARVDPDIVLTHSLEDRHQDHRLAAELTWNTWRNHAVLEYEIAKYEGDLQPTNLFIEISQARVRRKIAHLMRHFATQHDKSWFSQETFLALMRLRGLECKAASGHAEAFHARKLML